MLRVRQQHMRCVWFWQLLSAVRGGMKTQPNRAAPSHGAAQAPRPPPSSRALVPPVLQMPALQRAAERFFRGLSCKLCGKALFTQVATPLS
ncbi:MAG: hypothetical protein J3K34DRAFT_436209, partial [Monoraphidium minutum]